MAFTYDYPRPAVTTDAVVVRLHPAPHVLLIQRKSEPFKGGWALPGGFLDEHEDLDACVRRELAEETGLTGVELHPLANFSRPGRDPRGWTVSAAYVGLAPDGADAQAGDDAARCAGSRSPTCRRWPSITMRSSPPPWAGSTHTRQPRALMRRACRLLRSRRASLSPLPRG